MFYPRLKDPPNGREMKVPKGRENGGTKMISGLKNVDIRPQCFGEYKIQRGSILKIGMKFSRKKTNGKRQIRGGESYRRCFGAEV